MDSINSGSLQSSTSAAAEGECHSRTALNHSTNHHQQQPPPPLHHHQINPLLWSETLLSSSELPLVRNTPSTNFARNPKKRSRASRRAPTTILTTNTDNFRAMVQEFTGIPSPPFTSSLPSIATSFDLFGGPSAVMRSNINRFDNLPQQPSYQKLQSSSSSVSSFLDCCYLPNTMQSPSNSLDQSPFLNRITTENHAFSKRFGGIRQTQIEDQRTTLQDHVTFQQTPQSAVPEK